MDEISSIRAFIMSVEKKGFSAAARHTDVSISAIARQVGALENELGTRLINRNTRSQSLTEAGRLYYERMRSLLYDLDSAKRDVQAMKEDVKGLLRATIRASVATTVMQALPSFLTKYPDLKLDLSVTDERRNLVAEGIDVAVWLGQMDDSSLICRRLSPSKRVVCGSPAYFATHGVPNTPEDLQNHNCLVFNANHYDDVWRFSNASGVTNIKVSGNIRSSTGVVLVEGAVRGIGLSLVQSFSARQGLENGTLRTVLDDYDISPTGDETSLFLVYPSTRGVNLSTRAFIDFLVNLFKQT